MIPAFEEAVTGMEPSEEKTITIPSDQAYGTHRSEYVLKVDRMQFPPHIQP